MDGLGAVILLGVLGIALVLTLLATQRREVIYAWEVGLLYRDGVYKRTLPAGSYRIWRVGRRIEIYRVPTHNLVATTGPLDVLSVDRFAFRVSVSLIYSWKDQRQALEERLAERLPLAAKEAVTSVISKRTLEALLAERGELGSEILAAMEPLLPEAQLESALIAGLTLPPEIRRLVVEVEKAKLEGQAALERARGEHAALRALANAARIAKDNPELMNLRTLQALGKGSTLVLGQPGWSPNAKER